MDRSHAPGKVKERLHCTDGVGSQDSQKILRVTAGISSIHP